MGAVSAAPSPAHPGDTVCGEHSSISAKAVQTKSQVRKFVRCAAEYIEEHGAEEARRAFHEDERWKHGPTYVFVSKVEDVALGTPLVFPPNPDQEGVPRTTVLDAYGVSYYKEVYRTLGFANAGWINYVFTNPATGMDAPKSSYVIELDWNGQRAVVGAGIYQSDIPATCTEQDVNAADLESDPSDRRLREFVRCAALVVESQGYFAKQELERNPRWTHGSSYVFVMDTMGNQVLSGGGIRVNGRAPHEWGGRRSASDQFGGRDIAKVGDTFGEAFIYYNAVNPGSGTVQGKVSMLKRVVAQGVPLLVGAGYYPSPGTSPEPASCADHSETAQSVEQTQSPESVEAFVNCAAEYLAEHGPEETRRAFNEDERWRYGSIYLFVDELSPSGDDARSFVFPPEPSLEGLPWGGPQVDWFGTDFFFEEHRVSTHVDDGWLYYGFEDYSTGQVAPKQTYIRKVDWNGVASVIGAGIYNRDLPGTCDPAHVNARALDAQPNLKDLEEFVTCAALEFEANGLFGGQNLATSSRWLSGSIYVFVINAVDGEVLFSGSQSSFAVSGRIPQALFNGHDVVRVGAETGEAHPYYFFLDRKTGQIGKKLGYFKRVFIQGLPLLVGAGIIVPQ